MEESKPQGCVEPGQGPIDQKNEPSESPSGDAIKKKELKMQVMVGKEAPDFGAGAYHKGGFTNVKLSDFRGKWVVLCFYPGDFTFV